MNIITIYTVSIVYNKLGCLHIIKVNIPMSGESFHAYPYLAVLGWLPVTMDYSTVWQGILYKGHYAANINQAMVWLGALCERHYAANIDQAIV